MSHLQGVSRFFAGVGLSLRLTRRGVSGILFRLLPCGFAHRDLREHIAALTGRRPESITPGRMTYDLRRLRLHSFIEQIPGTHHFQVTEFGLRACLFFTRVHARILRPGFSQAMPNAPPLDSALRRCFQQLEAEIILSGSKREQRPRRTASITLKQRRCLKYRAARSEIP